MKQLKLFILGCISKRSTIDARPENEPTKNTGQIWFLNIYHINFLITIICFKDPLKSLEYESSHPPTLESSMSRSKTWDNFSSCDQVH